MSTMSINQILSSQMAARIAQSGTEQALDAQTLSAEDIARFQAVYGGGEAKQDGLHDVMSIASTLVDNKTFVGHSADNVWIGTQQEVVEEIPFFRGDPTSLADVEVWLREVMGLADDASGMIQMISANLRWNVNGELEVRIPVERFNPVGTVIVPMRWEAVSDLPPAQQNAISQELVEIGGVFLAAQRGAAGEFGDKHGSTVGGIAGAALGGPTIGGAIAGGLVGSIAGGLIGGALGDMLDNQPTPDEVDHLPNSDLGLTSTGQPVLGGEESSPTTTSGPDDGLRGGQTPGTGRGDQSSGAGDGAGEASASGGECGSGEASGSGGDCGSGGAAGGGIK